MSETAKSNVQLDEQSIATSPEQAVNAATTEQVTEQTTQETAVETPVTESTRPATRQEIMERIKDVPFTVTSIEKKDGKELPPSLFDLGLLQTECDRKYGIPIDVTLQTVQSLY